MSNRISRFFERHLTRWETFPILEAPTKKKTTKSFVVTRAPKRQGVVYSGSVSKRYLEFKDPEYNMGAVSDALVTESFFRRAVSKYCEQIWRNGYEFTGENPQAVEYIKKRLSQIAEVTGTPTKQLFEDIAQQLVTYSNCFIVKSRGQPGKESGGRIRTTFDNKTLKPVSGYWVINTTTTKVARDRNGKVLGYKQVIPGIWPEPEWKPQDVIHIYIDRMQGLMFGTPIVIPVLDDIRALRKIEENVELAIFQYAMPIYQYKVGTEKDPASPDEITDLQSVIENMPTEGTIVTPERHDIHAIGAQGRVLECSGYLKYFKERVFAGLGMSTVSMGSGECYTADTQTLTENGWKYHNEIDHTKEKIATYNPRNKKIEFKLSTYKHESHYDSDVITFKSQHTDIKVTPEHDMWISTRSSKKWRKVKAKDLADGLYSEFLLLENVPFEESVTTDSSMAGLDCSLDDFAELVGYFVSEGWVNRCSAAVGRYRTHFSQNIGPTFDNMCNLFDRIGVSYATQLRKDKQVILTIYGKALYQYLARNINHGCRSKNLPREVFTWPRSSRAALLEALIAGDGTKCSKSTLQTYYTTSPQLADDVQILAMSLGYAAKVKKCSQDPHAYGAGNSIYRVYITGNGKRFRPRILTKEMVSREPYSGTIYCYEVPNHLFVTRRNGKVTIQGNTVNRSTAEVLDAEMRYTTRKFQMIFRLFIEEFMIRELLAEGGWDYDQADLFNKVELFIPEIDTDTQIKMENHFADLFQKNAITETEMRTSSGRDPMTDEERKGTNFNLYTIKERIIQAIDESYNEWLQSGATRTMEKPSLAGALKPKKNAAASKSTKSKAVSNKNTPRNQHGTSMKPSASIEEPYLTDDIESGPLAKKTRDILNDLDCVDYSGRLYYHYNILREDLVKYIGLHYIEGITDIDREGKPLKIKESLGDFEAGLIKSTVGLTKDDMAEDALRYVLLAYNRGVKQAMDEVSIDTVAIDRVADNKYLERHVNKHIGRFLRDVTNMIERTIRSSVSKRTVLTDLRAAFDALEFRMDAIARSSSMRALNMGMLRVFRKLKVEDTWVKTWRTSDDDDECWARHHGKAIKTKGNLSYDDLPPYHYFCVCHITSKEPTYGRGK